MPIKIPKPLPAPKPRTNRNGLRPRTGTGYKPGTIIYHRKREREYLVMPNGSWRRVSVILQESK